MNAKDIKFVKEFCFNGKLANKETDLKEGSLYEYNVDDTSLFVGDKQGYAEIEIQGNIDIVLEELDLYKTKSLLRLDRVKEGMCFFSLLEFHEKINYGKDTPFEIIVDQAVYAILRKRKIDIDKAVKYLKDEILLDDSTIFAFGDNKKDGIISLIGKKIIVQIKESPQGYLHVIDLVDNRNGSSDKLVSLIYGDIHIKSVSDGVRSITSDFKEKYNALIHDNSELLSLWRLYDTLELESIKAEAKELGYLKYTGWRSQGGNLYFNVVDRVEPSFLKEDTYYVIVPTNAFNEKEPLDYASMAAIKLGTEYDPNCKNSAEFIISDEEIDVFKRIPEKGYIVPSISGSVVQNKRRSLAQNNILTGKNCLPGLNVLLQSGEVVGIATKHRNAISEETRKKVFEGKAWDFNDRQKKAIDIAINTPDIAIIQGPPGTGKTTVIQGIVERIHELENGQARILITSTQHEAVDNAVKDVTYSGVPVNRVYSRRQKNYDDSPIYEWVDTMIKESDEWISKNQRPTKLSGLYKRLNALETVTFDGLVTELKLLLQEIQALQFSADIQKEIDSLILLAIESKTSAGVEATERLQELISLQRLDEDSFFVDGAENLLNLSNYLKYDATDLNFAVPDYWRQLRRMKEASEDFKEIFEKYKSDILCLQKEFCKTNMDTSEIKERLNCLVENIQKEASLITQTKEEKLYDLVCDFRRDLTNPENVKSLITAYSQLNAATCQQSASDRLNPGLKGFKDRYHYVIIDEAARSNPLDLLIPMSLGEKIILVGDSKQLPHLVDRDIIEAVEKKIPGKSVDKILEESLFLRLFNLVKAHDQTSGISRTCSLTEQRRMHPDICDVVNQFYLDNEENALVSVCSKEEKAHNLGLYRNKALCWLEIPNSIKEEDPKGRSKRRECEVSVIRDELSKVLDRNLNYKIGIISFYRNQVVALQEMVDREFQGDSHRIKVGTVDAFQGREFDVVFLSTVRSNKYEDLKKRVGFLNDDRRLCVAMSRAKRLLITVGDSTTVAYDPENNIEVVKSLNELLKACKDENKGYYYEYTSI